MKKTIKFALMLSQNSELVAFIQKFVTGMFAFVVVGFFFLDQAECKSTIHWLCDYVTYQANKKATHHSRDLHSMIVAAIACIQSWIMSHPWLLDSQVHCLICERKLGQG